MIPVILYRKQENNSLEENTIKQYFPLFESRMLIRENNLVIGRYSVLPFYKELEQDVLYNNASLINDFEQHRFVADIGTWYPVLKDFTPKTWDQLYLAPDNIKLVLKGETNSRKFQWDTHMFANNKKQASVIMADLMNDSLLTYQKIYAREYVPLKTYMIGLNNLPITKEFRFFVAYNKILSGGFYWSSMVEDLGFIPDYKEVPLDFLNTLIYTISNRCNFYTLDVAQTEDDRWILIELNDGQMAGLSENIPEILYSNLRKAINEHFK